MKKKYVVGVDLGGTKIYTALVDLEGNIIKEKTAVQTPRAAVFFFCAQMCCVLCQMIYLYSGCLPCFRMSSFIWRNAASSP